MMISLYRTLERSAISGLSKVEHSGLVSGSLRKSFRNLELLQESSELLGRRSSASWMVNISQVKPVQVSA